MLSKALIAAMAIASTSAAAVGDEDSIGRRSIERRLAGDICIASCKNGGKRSLKKFWGCECEDGYGGACCGQCSTKPIETADIDLDEFTRATWYVQKQQVNGFQDADSLYCVTATYGLDEASLEGQQVPFFDGAIFSVNNYGNKGGVNQNIQAGEDAPILCGRVTGGEETGKLSVAPCFLPNIAAGAYWVAGVGTADDGTYTWAVIIGGQPKEFGPDNKCTTKLDGINNSGLWLFSRTPEASSDEIDAMMQVLDDQGISKGLLLDVVHTGCNYEGAVIKA